MELLQEDFEVFAYFDTEPLDFEIWLVERLDGAAEANRDTKVESLGLDRDRLAGLFRDATQHLNLPFPESHTDPYKVPIRTYGELQDAFREARRVKNHPHTNDSKGPQEG